jgi:FkbM family methyltransferase
LRGALAPSAVAERGFRTDDPMTLKHELRKRLWTFGLDVSRFEATSHPVARRRQLLAQLRIDVVLDVGANVGQWASELRDEVGFTGRIRSFEPMRAAFGELQSRAAGDADWEVFNCGLGDDPGEHVIHVAGNSYSSSLLKMLPAGEAAAPESRTVGQETVTVKTLDDVFESLCSPDDRIYLKIDTQGYEGRVLRGAKRSLARIDAVQLEMSLVPLYEGELSLLELVQLMQDEGFDMVALEPGFSDPRSGRLLQVDGVFDRR